MFAERHTRGAARSLLGRSGRSHLKVASANRVCEAPECDTVLSIYNPEPRCAAHLVAPRPGERTVRRVRTSGGTTPGTGVPVDGDGTGGTL